MSMLVQHSKHRLSSVLNAQGKAAAAAVAFSPSTSTNINNINNFTSPTPVNCDHSHHVSVLNPKPPTPPSSQLQPQIQQHHHQIPQASQIQQQQSHQFETQQDQQHQQVSYSTTTSHDGPQYEFETNSNNDNTPENKPRVFRKKDMAANPKRVSNERIYHGRSFDARVEALKYLLTSKHFAMLFRAPTTTTPQAASLLDHAIDFRFVDLPIVFHAYLSYHSRRGNLTEVLRTIERMRERNIAFSDRERMHISRANRKARAQGDKAVRSGAIKGWVHLKDPEMCLACYESMRTAGVHPGLSGFTAMLGLFAEKGDKSGDISARLIEDMRTLNVAYNDAPRKEGGERLGLPLFKHMLRFHAGLAQRDVCNTILNEMKRREIEEDEEVSVIMTSIAEREKELELDNLEDEFGMETPDKIKKKNSQSVKVHNLQSTAQVNIPTTTPTPPQPPTPPTPPIPPVRPTPETHFNSNSNFYETNPLQQNHHFFVLPQQQIYRTPSILAHEIQKLETALNGERPSSETYHSLLQMASRENDAESCERLLVLLERDGIEKMETTYTYLIEALKENHARCEDLFNTMKMQGLHPSRSTQNTMLWIYCAQRRVGDAFALFEEMKMTNTCDTAAYNTLMRVYAIDDNLQSVMGLSADMKQRGIAHDIATYTVMVEMLGRFGIKGVFVVDALMREMQDNNILPDVVMYDALMDIYGGVGHFDKCTKLWEEMGARGVVLGAGSCARFLEKHCRRDPNLYVMWKKVFSGFLPP